MTTWNPRANELFLKAADMCSPDGRREFLDRECAGAPALRAEVEALLEANDRAGGFLEVQAPAAHLVATVEAPSAAERPGSVIGAYKLMEQIGEGGMGLVFVAEQQHPVRRRVALKVIKPGMDTRTVVARFEAERQALALMDHPNIAKVLDAGATDTGRPYFVMELVRGVPITQYCDANNLTPRDRLGLFVSVCQAVQHAHQKGVIHRDIKPSNVLVTSHDGVPVVKVIDFGVAKAVGQQLTDKTVYTQFTQLLGTPLYMSPEQAGQSGLDVDTRTDIYALGVLLYELLTGTTPFDKDRLNRVGDDELRRIIREEEPPRPSTRISTLGAAAATVSACRGSEPRRLSALVRGELDWIVMKALEKDRNRRYESASSFAADVQRYLSDEPVQACPPSAAYRFRKFARRNRREVLTAAVVAAAGVAGVGGLVTSNLLISREKRAKEDALEQARVEAYYRCIELAYGALLVNNLGDALRFLNDCPEDLRGWEWRYLMRLCRVEPLVIRDKAGFHSLAFSSDGGRIASASADGSVKVWDSQTGKMLAAIPAHKGFAACVAFHPAGNHLLSVGVDKLAKVWDLTAKPERNVFECACDGVHLFGTAYAGAFSPLASDRLAVGCEGKVTVWNWRTHKPVHTFPGHGPHRIALAFSRDGRRLATGNWRGSVKLWDPEAGGEPLRTFPEKRHVVVASLAFSPDNSQLAAATFVRRVEVLDTASGELLHSLPQSGLVLGVAYSPDGRLIVSAGEDKIVHLRDAASGRELLGLRGHKGVCSCVAFSPDGQRLASAGADGTIRVWDATPLRGDERQEAATFSEHGTEVWSLAIAPGGKQVLSAAFGPPVMIWDAKTKDVVARFTDHDSVVFCVAWHPGGRRIAVAGASGDQFTVRVTNLGAKGDPDGFTLTASSEYFAVAFSPDGQYLVTGSGERRVEVWDAGNGQAVHTLGAHKGVLRGLAFSPDRDHKYLASMSSDGEVKLWDAKRLGEKDGPPLRSFPAHSPGVGLSMAFRPDGKQLVTSGKGYAVKIWDVETDDPPKTLQEHNGDVYTVAFSPDGRRVASAGEDSTVKVWDSHTGELLRNFRGHTGLISTMAFLDDRTLITGSRDSRILFWDLTQPEGTPDL